MSEGMPDVLAVAWGLQEVPQRGPSRGLTHERIVRSAVEIADADGLEAVTMSRVAGALGFTTMSLYRYVRTKDDLLVLMQDAVSTLPDDARACILAPSPDTDGGDEAEAQGREDADSRDAVGRLRAFAGGLRRIYLAHPWVLQVRRSALGVLLPGAMEVVDLGMAACGRLRLDDGERIAVVLTLSSYVAAAVGVERDIAGRSRVELDDSGWAALAGAISPERFPRVAPLLLAGDYAAGEAGQPTRGEDGVDAELDFGLDRLLDGLVALHGRRGELGWNADQASRSADAAQPGQGT